MSRSRVHQFDCQFYIGKHNRINPVIPYETGPVRVAHFEPITFDELVAPDFQELIGVFQAAESVRVGKNATALKYYSS